MANIKVLSGAIERVQYEMHAISQRQAEQQDGVIKALAAQRALLESLGAGAVRDDDLAVRDDDLAAAG